MANSELTKYAMSASRGFSYLVPVPVQAVLTKLLKKLPTPARSIYREYYRDLMCSKDCAQDSAKAMAEFVERSFPIIMTDHDRLARLMNEEIDEHEHSYVPVKFPVIGGNMEEETDEGSGEEVEVSRKRRPASSAPRFSSRSNGKRRKTINELRTAAVTLNATREPEALTEASVLNFQPAATRNKHTGLSSQPSEISITTTPTPEAKKATSQLTINEATIKPSEHAESLGKSDTTEVKDDIDGDSNSDALGSRFVETIDSWDELNWPDGKWIDGLEAIEAFPWDRNGSRWEPGRGLVSVYYEDIQHR